MTAPPDSSRSADRPRRGYALAVLVLLLAMQQLLDGAMPLWPRERVFDAYQRIAPRVPADFPLRVIEIDEAALERHGQWPWPRSRLAELVDRTAALGALAIGIDVLMPEPDRHSPQAFADAYPAIDESLRARLRALPSNDELLAQAIARHRVVVARAGIDRGGATRSRPLRSAPVVIGGGGVDPTSRLIAFPDALANTPELEAAAAGHGLTNEWPDADGVVRRAPLVARVGEQVNASMAVELLRLATGAPLVELRGNEAGVVGVGIADGFFATDARGAVTIRFSLASPGRRLSADAILRGDVEPGALAGQLALIGVTATGVAGAPPTPVAPAMDGVEIQAQIVETLLDGRPLSRPTGALVHEAVALALSGLALIVLVPMLGPVRGLALTLAAVAGLGGAAFALFATTRLLYDPSFVAAAVATIYVTLLYSMLSAGVRQRRALDRALAEQRFAAARIAGELGAARQIQMGILTSPGAIEKLPASVDVHAMLEPAREVGGDLYDVFMLDRRRLFFLVGDVAGKGVPASLFMALSTVLCRTMAQRVPGSVAERVSAANVEISRANPQGLFVTAVAGVLDVESGDLDYCIAGHESPVVLHPGRAPRELAGAGGPPLSTLEEYAYPAERGHLDPGDTLLLLTDGITDAVDRGGELFGRRRLMEFLATVDCDGAAARTVAQLHERVRAFSDAEEPADDVTVVAIRYVGPCAAPDGPAAAR